MRLHGGADPCQPVHLHVRASGSPGAAYALLFRDWLQHDSRARDGYAGLKRRWAADHRSPAGYAAAKEPWFTDVAWPQMQAWKRSTGWVPPI